eukprot:GEMP01042519.1.p2 GENE.GEMP01042519.1~~GEMP01042519.1.p2  ORF type:complete len:195 (+),score=31.10 GEMP01042519.1:106-690(+)
MAGSMKADSHAEENNAVEEQKRKMAKEAAGKAAREMGNATKAGAVEFKNYVVENPTALKTLGLLCGLALTTVSMFGLINILNIVNPIFYLINGFNAFFGLILLVVEGPPNWKWCGFRTFIFTHCGFLGKPVGRALFYCYIGALVVGIAYAWWPYYIVGGVLILCGVMQFIRLCTKGPETKDGHREFTDTTCDAI